MPLDLLALSGLGVSTNFSLPALLTEKRDGTASQPTVALQTCLLIQNVGQGHTLTPLLWKIRGAPALSSSPPPNPYIN